MPIVSYPNKKQTRQIIIDIYGIESVKKIQILSSVKKAIEMVVVIYSKQYQA